MEKVSIVIPTYNKIEFTKACINSLKKYDSKKISEIIIVDNGSSDGTKEYLVKNKKWKLKYILNKENLGFAKACNAGASKSTGNNILFLNNDTEIIDSKWIHYMLRNYEEKKVAIVGAKLLFPDDTIQHAGVVFEDNKSLPKHIYYRMPKDRPYINKKRKFQAVTGACLMIKKDIFEKLGGFDESYLNGMEDIDLCLKVIDLGYDIIYEPKSVLYHYESISEGREDEKVLDNNRKLFLSRWAGKYIGDQDKFFNEDGLVDEFSKLKSKVKSQENEIKKMKEKNEALNNQIREVYNRKAFKIINFFSNIINRKNEK